MGRPPCCDKSNVKRGLWTSEEDAKILAYVSKHGTGNWTLVPKKAGLNRCGKSCRLRWTNYLRPDLKHDGFTPEEEDLIINLHKAIGSRWSVIAQRLPGRTDNDVKNYWNTKLRKKLKEMGIDPVTHKPFSQMLSDFGSISGIPNIKNHFCNKNINTDTLMFKPDQSSSSSVLTGLQNTNSLVTKPEPKYFVRNKTMFGSSWDVSAQFHVPNLENFTTQPQFYTHEVTSSSCSSSSSSTISQLTSPQPTPPSSSSSFSWSEFLLCEPEGIELLNNSTLAENDEISGYRINGENSRNINQIGKDEASRTYDYDKEIDASSSSSAASSFVDAILSRENEMISSQLFGFFDGSLD